MQHLLSPINVANSAIIVAKAVGIHVFKVVESRRLFIENKVV